MDPRLSRLERVYRRLCVAISFAESHGVPLTFDRLRAHFGGTAESNDADHQRDQSNDLLLMEDLGRLKAISPRSLHLEYQCRRSMDLVKTDVDFFRVRTSPIGRDVQRESWDLVVSLDHAATAQSDPGRNGNQGGGGRKRKKNSSANDAKSSSSNKKAKKTKAGGNTLSLLQLIEARQQLFQEDLEAFIRTHVQNNDGCWWDELCELGTRSLPSSPATSAASSRMEASPTSAVTTHNAIDSLKSASFYTRQIVHQRAIPARSAVYKSLDIAVHPSLMAGLETAQHIDLNRLYSHQYEAIRAIMLQKKHVVVSTSTSSGKSLIFNVPVIDALLTAHERNESFTALYIFPTKALAQDQKQKLEKLLNACGVSGSLVATYDGDTGYEDRARIRDHAQIIITNPDMLHCSILPYHRSWAHFFKSLRYIVLDEIHVYSGLMGSHVALVMRRLFRLLTTMYDNDSTRSISCSATIANPSEHFQSLFNLPEANVSCISQDGSPTATKDFVIWSPDLQHSNLLSDCTQLILFFAQNNMRTVVFCKSRKQCEVVAKELKAVCEQDLALRYLADKIKSYRGGFKPELRREIEDALFKGDLSVVVATNALELGIDVGDLDVTVHVGFPSSVSSLWQQAGRAGRRKTHSVAVYVLDQDPLNQFYGTVDPECLFSNIGETAVINWESPSVLDQHLQCAAMEKAIDPDTDTQFFGETLAESCSRCLKRINNRCYMPLDMFLSSPALIFPIRCIESEHLVVRDLSSGKELEELELSRALYSIYEGAVYFHDGNSFIIQYADFVQKHAGAVPTRVNYITRQRDFTDVDGIKTLMAKVIDANDASQTDDAIHVHYGHVQTTFNVYGYYKFDPKRNVILDTVDIHANPVERKSTGIWIKLPKSCVDTFLRPENEHLNLSAGIHAATHLLISIIPVYVLCNPTDIETEHKSPLQTRQRPAQLIVYDRYGGSTGFGKIAFEKIDAILKHCMDTIESCQCTDGCPNCCLSAQCCEYNAAISKASARLIFQHLNGTPPPTDPDQDAAARPPDTTASEQTNNE